MSSGNSPTEKAGPNNGAPIPNLTTESGLPMNWAGQAFLAAIIESSDDAIISKDLNGIIRSWNKGAERLFGYSAEEAIGKPIAMLAVPERIQEIPDILRRIRLGQKIDHYETKRQTKYGRVLDISLTISPIRDANGEIIGASKVARDITLQKRAAELQERLAAIVESSDDAIISKDLNGIIRSWNLAAERIFGYTAEEAIGKPVSMLAVPDRVEEMPNILDRIRKGERVDHYETKRQTKDGRVLDVSLTVSPVRNAQGVIVGASKIARNITERKRLEAALDAQSRQLAARERYLQAVLESLPECIKVLGPGGELQEMNRAGLQMVEADRPEQVIGDCIYPLIVENHREAFRRVNESVFQGSAGGTLQFEITGLKGTRRTFETNVVPLRGDDDRVIAALSATRDVTEWKKAEDALRASEARFRAAVSAVSSLIWTNNSEGKMTGDQPGWTSFTGQTSEEAQGYGWANVVHPEDAQPTIDAWNQAVLERRPFIHEHRVRRRDGVYRLFSIRAVPVFDDSGAIREWVGVHTDITEERQLIEQRTAALKREREARQTAELLNKVGPLLAAELDPQLLTQKVTDIATQLMGAQFGALFHNVRDERGESYLLYTISGVPKEYFSKFPMPRNTPVFGPTFAGEAIVRSDDITMDYRYGKNPPYYGMPKGHLPVRSYIAAPVVSRTGEVLGGLFFGHAEAGVFTSNHEELLTGLAAQAAIALDNARLYTESQRAREALTQSNEELRQANADLEQFAFSASHDLKEPLRTMSIYSQILQRRYAENLGVEAIQYLDNIAAAARRMDKLVQDLLVYTKSAAPLEPGDTVSDVEAGAVLERAISNLSHLISESGATVVKGPLPMLHVREVHLLQIFQNLLENAVKYRDEELPSIRVEAMRDGALWRICIHDNGIGIAPEYKDQVFGVFKRLHTSDKYSGTGIGLAICQRLVARYGGRIWVESEGEGKGSTFCFTLPGGEPNA